MPSIPFAWQMVSRLILAHRPPPFVVNNFLHIYFHGNLTFKKTFTKIRPDFIQNIHFFQRKTVDKSGILSPVRLCACFVMEIIYIFRKVNILARESTVSIAYLNAQTNTFQPMPIQLCQSTTIILNAGEAHHWGKRFWFFWRPQRTILKPTIIRIVLCTLFQAF